jgi:hypothetical protein
MLIELFTFRRASASHVPFRKWLHPSFEDLSILYHFIRCPNRPRPRYPQNRRNELVELLDKVIILFKPKIVLASLRWACRRLVLGTRLDMHNQSSRDIVNRI